MSRKKRQRTGRRTQKRRRASAKQKKIRKPQNPPSTTSNESRLFNTLLTFMVVGIPSSGIIAFQVFAFSRFMPTIPSYVFGTLNCIFFMGLVIDAFGGEQVKRSTLFVLIPVTLILQAVHFSGLSHTFYDDMIWPYIPMSILTTKQLTRTLICILQTFLFCPLFIIGYIQFRDKVVKFSLSKADKEPDKPKPSFLNTHKATFYHLASIAFILWPAVYGFLVLKSSKPVTVPDKYYLYSMKPLQFFLFLIAYVYMLYDNFIRFQRFYSKLHLIMLPLLCISMMSTTILSYTDIYKYTGLIDENNQITHAPITCFYFAIVTWTSTAYGEIKPTPEARLFAASEPFLAFPMMGLLITIFASMLFDFSKFNQLLTAFKNSDKSP